MHMKKTGKRTQFAIGLALGSGSSRGWAHIGILNALSEQGIEPDILCGTSIGSLVGASYVADNLSKLEEHQAPLHRICRVAWFSSSTGHFTSPKLVIFPTRTQTTGRQ